jgi:glycine/D-amino acid oxidase-like deaminating enzyme
MSAFTNTLRALFTRSFEQGSTVPGPENERMDLHSGTPYWTVQDKVHPFHPKLQEDLRTDVIIVGGGITGALCAQAFSEAGLATVVVDARPMGQGSTCASTALLQYEIDTPLHKLVDLVGERNAVRSYQLCAQAIERLGGIASAIGVERFAERPSLQYASKRGHVNALVKEQKVRTANGLPCVFLDEQSEVHKVLGFDAPAVLRTPMAAEMDALEFTHALHARNRENGVKVFQDTTVVDFRDNGTGIELRTANGRHLRARDLVYATGYESRDLLPRDVIRLHSTYALVSEANMAQEPWPDQALIWETASPYLYMRTAPGGRIIMGGRDEAFRAPYLRDAMLAKKTKALEQDFQKLFPHLSLRHAHAWCGTFGSTKDGLPYIDQGPRDRHSYYALGMGGNGITFSVIAAEIIRDRILGRPNTDSAIFRFDR